MVKKTGKKSKQGRPKADDADRKSVHVHITCTKAEKAKIIDFAKKIGKRHTTWARETLLKAVE